AESQSRSLRLLVPFSGGVTLPRALARLRWCSAEMKEPGLLARVGFELQRGVILPGNLQAHRKSNDPRGAKRLAFVVIRFVPGEIPGVGDLPAYSVERDAGVITLWWRDHSPAPVFGHHRHPVTGQIDGCGR